MNRVFAHVVWWLGMVVVFAVALVTRWPQEKIHWWEDKGDSHD